MKPVREISVMHEIMFGAQLYIFPLAALAVIIGTILLILRQRRKRAGNGRAKAMLIAALLCFVFAAVSIAALLIYYAALVFRFGIDVLYSGLK